LDTRQLNPSVHWRHGPLGCYNGAKSRCSVVSAGNEISLRGFQMCSWGWPEPAAVRKARCGSIMLRGHDSPDSFAPVLMRYRQSVVANDMRWTYSEELDVNLLDDGIPAVFLVGPMQTQTLTEVRNEVADRD
jgi:hypothetical protein